MRVMMRLVLLVMLMLLAACGSDATPTPTPILETATPTATVTPTNTPTPIPTVTPIPVPERFAADPSQQVSLRFVHAGPQLPRLNVFVDTLAVATNLDPGTVTLPTGVAPGAYTLRVQNAIDRSAPAVLEQAVTYSGGQQLIVVISGTPDDVSVAQFAESSDTLNAGQSRVRFVHAVPGGPEVTLFRGSQTLSTPTAFGQISPSALVESEDVQLAFMAGDQTLLTLPLELRERFSYTLVLFGSAGDPASLQVAVVNNRVAGAASTRVVHAAEGTPAVDVYANGTIFAQNVDHTRASERIQMPAQTYQVAAYPTGSDINAATPLVTAQVTANIDQALSLVLMGPPEALRIVPITEDLSPVRPGVARMVFVNSLASVPVARVAVNGEALPELPDIRYGQASEPILLLANSVNFFWDRVEDRLTTDAVEQAENVQLEAARSYLYVLTGRDINEPPIIFSEPVGIDPNLADLAVNEVPTATPAVPTRVRFVNAVDSAPLVDFTMDEAVVATELAGRQETPFLIIPAGEHDFSLRLTVEQTMLGGNFYLLEPAQDYTAFGFGFEADRYDVLVVPDLNMSPSESTPVIRLVNLTNDSAVSFRLGAVPGGSIAASNANAGDDTAVETEEPIATVGAEPTVPSVPEPTRRPAAFLDTTRITNSVAGLSASIGSFAQPGEYDLLITDADDRIALIFERVTLSPGSVYEVIVYQDPFTGQARGFYLTYPAS